MKKPMVISEQEIGYDLIIVHCDILGDIKILDSVISGDIKIQRSLVGGKLMQDSTVFNVDEIKKKSRANR